jgi:alpha/beta superfamily hydrolase
MPTPQNIAQSFLIPGPEGDLEALYHEPEGVEQPRALSVVCHPHPVHGGTMHSTVAFRTARGLQAAGLACLRINFRGVGRSAGEYHGEGGEEEDAAAALDWLRAKHPGVPTWAAGFSFGSRTVFGLAKRDERIQRLVLVGFPLKIFHLDAVDELRQPTYFVWGADDEYGTLDDLRVQYPDLPEHFQTHQIPDCDHFFKRHTKELEARVLGYALESLNLPAHPDAIAP